MVKDLNVDLFLKPAMFSPPVIVSQAQDYAEFILLQDGKLVNLACFNRLFKFLTERHAVV
jgi:hypothetical protein